MSFNLSIAQTLNNTNEDDNLAEIVVFRTVESTSTQQP